MEIAAQWPRVLVRRLSKRWIACLRRRMIAAHGFGSAASALRQPIHPPPAMLLTMNSSSPSRMAAGSGSTWGSVALTGSLVQVSCGIVRQCSFEYCRGPLCPARGGFPFLVDIIKSSGKDGIDIYVKPSSLYWFTGNITKLWLSGLPLLTVVLTLFFTCLAAVMISLKLNTNGQNIVNPLMDLAKLTL